MKRKVFFLLRISLAILFIVSGYLKLMEPPQNFLAVVYEYKILSGPAAKAFAAGMPWAELIFGVFLLKGLWIRFSTAVLWLMNSAFIVALGAALWRKLPITECGCFGGEKSFPLDKVLMMDAGLWIAFAALFLFSSQARWLSLDDYFGRKQ